MKNYSLKITLLNKAKFGILLILLLLSFVSAFGQESKIYVKEGEITLRELISEIERQTNYLVVYSNQEIDAQAKIIITFPEGKVSDYLDVLLKLENIRYEINNHYINLKRNKDSKPDPTKGGIRVFGNVTDSNRDPVIGARVVVKENQTGTITDVEGRFSISVPSSKSILVFSYLGFKTQEVEVGNNREIDIVLDADVRLIDEVVIVGYGTQKKVNLTGAVSQIGASELKDRPVTNMWQLLQGAIPNLNITIGSGKPGDVGTPNIRGNTSLGSSGAPLVLIDGIPGNINRVNPNDVESVTVLKDASASAIYGARAAFGVIMLTTKPAKKGKTRINYSNNFAWTTHATCTDFITSGFWNAKIVDISNYRSSGISITKYSDEDYDELWARVNDKEEHPDRPWVVVKQNNSGKDMYRYYANFDWHDYLYSKWRAKSNHNLTLSGTSEKTSYLLSAGYSEETGIIKLKPDVFKRFNVRSKLSFDVTDWLDLTNNTSFFTSNYKWFGKADNFAPSSTVITNPVYFYLPAYVPINPDGTIAGSTGLNNYQIGYGNHANWIYGKAGGQQYYYDLLSIFEANIKVRKDITLTANYGYQQVLTQYNYRQVRVPYSLYPGETSYWALADLSNDRLLDLAGVTKKHSLNVYGNYTLTLNNHNIKTIVGFNQEWQTYKNISGYGFELLSENLSDLSLTSGDMQVKGGLQEWIIRGGFYRLNYDYDGRYLFEASGRYDGSSRFPKHSRFAFFPSFSVGWRVSEEQFMSPLKSTIDNLKLRYSYGSLGNQNTANYGYIETMTTGIKNNYLINGEKIQVTETANPISDTYTWETVTTNNFGLDIDFFRARLSASTDFYIRETKNMLMRSRTLPAVYGASPPRENNADLRTKGYEISLGWRDKITLFNKPFSYWIKAMLSDYTSKITKYYNPDGLLSDYYEGKQLGEIWGYTFAGFFQSNEEAQAWASIVNQDKINKRRLTAPTAELKTLQAGEIKILDLDGSGVIDNGAYTLDDHGDLSVIGNNQPRYAYGLTLGANWNGIDFSVFFQGIGRKHWYPHKEAQMFWQVYSRPYSSFIPIDFMKNVWSPDNPNAYFPFMRSAIALDSELSHANNMYLQDLAYCKLRNLTIGYTMPERLMNKTRVVRNVRIYVSGENLFTWTKLKTDYIDPEEVSSDASGRTYPIGKTISCGIEISF